TFLAAAGLIRLGLQVHITALIEVDDMLPALAQGAIGIEIAEGSHIAEIVAKIDHVQSNVAVTCERAFMAALDGSCRTPIAGYATVKDGTITFNREALTLDGKHVFKASRQGTVADAERLGLQAGEEVRGLGGSLLTL
ncbi:MAG TPA: hydroxymethylbilane synthase, partial [Aestuariivirga sp.]